MVKLNVTKIIGINYKIVYIVNKSNEIGNFQRKDNL